MPDECHDVCPFHNDQDKLIKSVAAEVNDTLLPMVNSHNGYWKFFFWAAGIAFTIMGGMTYTIKVDVREMSKSVAELSRSMAVGNEQHRNNVERLNHHSDNLREFGNRLRAVEHEVE